MTLKIWFHFSHIKGGKGLCITQCGPFWLRSTKSGCSQSRQWSHRTWGKKCVISFILCWGDRRKLWNGMKQSKWRCTLTIDWSVKDSSRTMASAPVDGVAALVWTLCIHKNIHVIHKAWIRTIHGWSAGVNLTSELCGTILELAVQSSDCTRWNTQRMDNDQPLDCPNAQTLDCTQGSVQGVD